MSLDVKCVKNGLYQVKLDGEEDYHLAEYYKGRWFLYMGATMEVEESEIKEVKEVNNG